MPPKKGKEATRGNKQILEDNVATLGFYRNMVFIANGIYLTIMCILTDFFTTQIIILFLMSGAAYVASYQFMAFMARPKFSESGQIVDSGVDLNMEGGIAEHVKDLIILTSGCQLLSIISGYFWFLWLLAPLRAFWMLWKNILSPYFFQKGEPIQKDAEDKKQKKMERKMKRQNL